jgi:C-terminal processing protease CtpA/Prc
VYILTSARTFSAGEGFAFLLQERHRAEVVGEVTAGASNAGRPYRVNARFSVTIPDGQIKSAVGGGNWEGTGVTPDVTTTAADALNVAHARALRRMIDREQPGPWRDALERALRTVEPR